MANSINKSKRQRWRCTWVEQSLHFLCDRLHIIPNSSRGPSHFFSKINSFSLQYNTSVSQRLWHQIPGIFPHLDIRSLVPIHFVIIVFLANTRRDWILSVCILRESGRCPSRHIKWIGEQLLPYRCASFCACCLQKTVQSGSSTNPTFGTGCLLTVDI